MEKLEKNVITLLLLGGDGESFLVDDSDICSV